METVRNVVGGILLVVAVGLLAWLVPHGVTSFLEKAQAALMLDPQVMVRPA